jgi:protein O-mannosyl-transferase
VLAPTAILPFQNPMGEHRLYLASAGLWLAAASMLADTLTRRPWARAAAAVVILLLGARTYQRNRDWFDPLPLWRASVERAPGSWVAHRELAEVLRAAGICVGAQEEFRRTRELNPGFVDRQSHTTRCEASK